jgi:hypothetical protein
MFHFTEKWHRVLAKNTHCPQGVVQCGALLAKNTLPSASRSRKDHSLISFSEKKEIRTKKEIRRKKL